MKVEITENGTIELLEVYNPVELRSNANEVISICMRDSGFELTYEGNNYEAKNGILKRL